MGLCCLVGLGMMAGTAGFRIPERPGLVRFIWSSIAQPSPRSRFNSPAEFEFKFENPVQFENSPSSKARSLIVNTQELVYMVLADGAKQ